MSRSKLKRLNVRQRLYLQHLMWRRELGYLLNPHIPTHKDPNVKIADVACGTGYETCSNHEAHRLNRSRIWLIDLARELPGATLDDYDVSPAQFPHRNWLPANVTLNQLDAFGEVPPELIAKYDVVHIGLVVFLIKDGNPGALLNNLLRMLSRSLLKQTLIRETVLTA